MNFLSKRLRRTLLSGAVALGAVSLPAHAVQDVLETPAAASSIIDQTLLLDITQAGDRLVAVGARGHIVTSDDNGQTWNQASVPVALLLTAVSFADAKNGWAVGHGAVILHSNDGGLTWVKQFDGNEANQMIIKQAEGVVEGYEAALDSASDDEADDIAYQLEESQFALEDAQFDAEIGASKPLLDVLFLNDQEGFAVGAYGFVFKTNDAGRTWENYGLRVDNPDRFHINAITKIAGGALLMAGEAGIMFRSDDNGESWDFVESPYEGSFFGLTPTGEEGIVLAHGLRGNLYRSEDAGETWEKIDSNTESTLMSGAVGPTGNITIVGNSGVVLFSDDGGRTFKEHIRSDRLGNVSLLYTKRKRLILVGESGVNLTDSLGQNL